MSACWFPLNFIQLLTTANHNTVLWLFYLSVISHTFHKQPFKQTTGGRQINENPWKKMSLKYISESSSAAKQQHIIQGYTSTSSSRHPHPRCSFALHLSHLCWWVSSSSSSKLSVCEFLCVLAFYKLLKYLLFFSSSAPAVFRCRILSELCWSSHDAFNTHITKPCVSILVSGMCFRSMSECIWKTWKTFLKSKSKSKREWDKHHAGVKKDKTGTAPPGPYKHGAGQEHPGTTLPWKQVLTLSFKVKKSSFLSSSLDL